MPSLELYDRGDCPYSRLVRRTLEKLDLEYDETLVPEAHDERTDVQERTGQTSIPVLFDERHGEEFVTGSTEIVQHLQATYGD
jgi:glutaredoxin